MRRFGWILVTTLAVQGADLRLGLVGTDTSHVIAFTRAFNDPAAPGHIPGARVVAAYKGGSPDLASSHTRVDKFAAELQDKWKVQFYDDIPALCRNVDAVLLTSVDGRKHLEQARPIFAAGKRVFIDKPLASTLEDAREIARLAAEAKVPWFSSSSLRWSELANLKSEDALGATVWGPGPFGEHHYLDLSWYAIHPIEVLFTLLGTGCEEVTRISGAHEDIIVGRWRDGRIGTVRALRPSGGYGAVVYRPKQILQSPPKPVTGYGPMLKEIVRFFQTGVPPVPNAETLEIFAFMDAAQKSKEAGGRTVRLR